MEIVPEKTPVEQPPFSIYHLLSHVTMQRKGPRCTSFPHGALSPHSPRTILELRHQEKNSVCLYEIVFLCRSERPICKYAKDANIMRYNLIFLKWFSGRQAKPSRVVTTALADFRERRNRRGNSVTLIIAIASSKNNNAFSFYISKDNY